MELYLQYGNGMKGMCLELLEKWNGGTIILSPVNIEQNKINQYSKEFKKKGSKLMFDPQLFFTKDAREKLANYDYWPNENTTISDEDVLHNINKGVLKINIEIECERIILPSKQIKESNYYSILKQLKQSIKFFRSNTQKKLFSTIALYPESIRNTEFIEKIINDFSELDVDGYYIVPQPPNSEYIVTDATWSIGLLKLLTCLKFTKREVIVGYSNHQGLVYSLANVDAIASGNFMNTRAFSPDKFKKPTGVIKQKSNWFYVPNAMCEFKVILLDIAKQRGIIDFFKPVGLFENDDSNKLFSGANPSSANFTETNSFKHYLHCLKIQCNELKNETYENTYSKYEFLLNSAEKHLKEIKKSGISGQNRDFEDGIEANRIAMVACKQDYGFKLKFEWTN